MDEEFRNKLIDRFEGYELAELLDIKTEDLIYALSEIVSENRDFLEEIMAYGR